MNFYISLFNKLDQGFAFFVGLQFSGIGLEGERPERFEDALK
jgi:hypothetical protein